MLNSMARRGQKRWTAQETRAFLQFYAARKDEFCHSRKRRQAYAHVLQDMLSAGYDQNTTIMHLEVKMQTLTRAFKSSKEDAPFAAELKEIFGDRLSHGTSQALQVGVDNMFEVKPHTKVDEQAPTSSLSNFKGKIAEVGTIQFSHLNNIHDSKTNELNPESCHDDMDTYLHSIKEESSVSFISDAGDDADLCPKDEPWTSNSVGTQCNANEFTRACCEKCSTLRQIKLKKEIAILEMVYKIKEVDLEIKKQELKKLTTP